MFKKLWFRICLAILSLLSLTGCNIIGDVGNALTNSLKGFSIHFP